MDHYYGNYVYSIIGPDQLSKARKNISQIIELQPTNKEAMWLMAIISEYNHDTVGEANWYGRILEIDPDSVKVRQKLGEIREDLINDLFKPQGLEAIEPILLKLTAFDAQFDSYINGAISERKGDFIGAIDLYIKSLKLRPDFTRPKQRIKEILEDLVDESSKSIGLEEIEQIFQKAINFTYPENSDYVNGVILERKGNFKGAAESYLKALNSNSNYEPARNRIKGISVLLFRSNGNLEEAKGFCENLVKISPKVAAESYNCLICSDEFLYVEEGVEILNRIIELDSNESLYFNNRAYFLARINIALNFERAEKDAKTAIELNSSFQTAWVTYAEILALNGEKAKSQNVLEDALKSGKIDLKDLLSEANKDLNKSTVSPIEKDMLREFVAKYESIA